MSNIKLVLDLCIRMMNTRLTFSPYSFTILQAFIAMAVLGIIFAFVRDLLN